MRPTVLKISMDALRRNARAVRGFLPDSVKMMAVVKADGYGHGAIHAARAMDCADAFAVAIAEEAQALREGGVRKPILILGGAREESLREAVEIDAAQCVYTPEMLDILEDAAAQSDRIAKAHLKIDTGMSRVGVRGTDALDKLLAHWKASCPHVEMEGLFTHFGSPFLARQQNRRFKKALQAVRNAGFAPVAHAAATSAMAIPEFQYDMVRCGMALFGGYAPLEGRLEYAQTLVTKPIRVEAVPEGEAVGYGSAFVTSRETRVMTLPVGFADGYPRNLSGKASALVCGRRAPVIGLMAMDMMMLDVTDIPEADMDSEVVLLGAQGGDRITPPELANLAETVPYEIMTGFSPRIRREILPLSEE